MGTSERLFGTLALAVLAARLVALLFVPRAGGQEASGTASAERGLVVDRGPKGAPYVSGQLLVNLDRGASGAAVEARSRRAGGRVEDRLPDIDTVLPLLPRHSERAG